MIEMTKYGKANLMAIGGIILMLVDSPYPILYSFLGGIFIGKGLKLAKEHGQKNKNSEEL